MQKYKLSIITTIDLDVLVLHKFLDYMISFNKNLVAGTNVYLSDSLNIFSEDDFIALKKKYPQINLVYVKNFGTKDQILSIAKTIGFTVDDVILIIDSDMYESLSYLDAFLCQINSGANVVYGSRIYRNDVSWIRNLLSKVYNKLCSLIVGVDISDLNTPMILLTRNASKLLRMHSSTFSARFYIAHKYKDTLAEIFITTSSDLKKKSNYSFFSLVRVGVVRYIELILFAIFIYSRFIKKNKW